MGATPTYAERLGWPQNSRVVLFHVDDAGLCESANRGAQRVLAEGPAHSTSVMTCCPGFPSMAAWLRAHPETDAGVHLTLTSEFSRHRWRPLCDPQRVPGLLDQSGHMYADARAVMAQATAREVYDEIRAQYERACDAGIRVSHLDSHMGVLFTRPDFFEQFLRLGLDTGIPILAAAEPRSAIGAVAGLLSRAGRKLLMRTRYDFPRQSAEVIQRVWREGLPVVDYIRADSFGWPSQEKVKRLRRAIRQLRPGITVFLMHCAWAEPDVERLEGSAPTRIADSHAMLDPNVRKTLEREKIIPATWAEISARRAAVRRRDH